MKLDGRMRRHLARGELLAYAEAMSGAGAPVNATHAAHAAGCAVCAREVQAMRASLEFTGAADRIEPSNELTAQILLSAKELRQRPESRLRRFAGNTWFVLRATGYSAALSALAVLVFAAVLGDPGQAEAAPGLARLSPAQNGEDPADEVLRKAAADVATLTAAVRVPSGKKQGPRERQHRRAVSAMDVDIAAAAAALERNPGCRRATDIVESGIQRQAQTLRTLYAERSL